MYSGVLQAFAKKKKRKLTKEQAREADTKRRKAAAERLRLKKEQEVKALLEKRTEDGLGPATRENAIQDKVVQAQRAKAYRSNNKNTRPGARKRYLAVVPLADQVSRAKYITSPVALGGWYKSWQINQMTGERVYHEEFCACTTTTYASCIFHPSNFID